MSQDWLFCKQSFLQKHGEWILSGVLGVDLLDLNVTVGEVISEDEVLGATIVTLVLP